MKELLAVEFRSAENKLHYAIIGVTAIKLEEDDLLFETENPEKNIRLSENPIKEKGLKLQVYYPTEDDIRELFGNSGMFDRGLKVIDGRMNPSLTDTI
jgi:hypothetical protein